MLTSINIKKAQLTEPIIKIEKLNQDFYHWHAIFKGPRQSPYENGIFELDINLTQNYPLEPPIIKFLTKIFHPHISQQGFICLDILSDKWSPIFTIQTTILSIVSLLTDINGQNALRSYKGYNSFFNRKNKIDFLNPQIAIIYIKNKQNFQEIARQWTKMYATGDQNKNNQKKQQQQNQRQQSTQNDSTQRKKIQQKQQVKMQKQEQIQNDATQNQKEEQQKQVKIEEQEQTQNDTSKSKVQEKQQDKMQEQKQTQEQTPNDTIESKKVEEKQQIKMQKQEQTQQ